MNSPAAHALAVVEGEIVATQASPQLALFAPSAIDVAASFLESTFNPRTKRAYKRGIEDFFGDDPSLDRVAAFLAGKPGDIALALEAYQLRLHRRRLAPATINQRMSAVQSLLQYAFARGWSVTDGRGLIKRLKSRAFRDTRGISLEWLHELRAEPAKLYGANSIRCLRDTAILSMHFECGLRASELINLNVGDFSLPMLSVMITGKGFLEKEPWPLTLDAAREVDAYLHAAGHAGDKGPLIRNLVRWGQADANAPLSDKRGARLSYAGLYHLIKFYGRQIGVPGLTPHKLRHSSGTQASNATNGNALKVKALLRHADLNTTQIYIDTANDQEREMVNILGSLWRERDKPAPKGKKKAKT